jgi:hypothetical protein
MASKKYQLFIITNITLSTPTQTSYLGMLKTRLLCINSPFICLDADVRKGVITSVQFVERQIPLRRRVKSSVMSFYCIGALNFFSYEKRWATSFPGFASPKTTLPPRTERGLTSEFGMGSGGSHALWPVTQTKGYGCQF